VRRRKVTGVNGPWLPDTCWVISGYAGTPEDVVSVVVSRSVDRWRYLYKTGWEGY
jgi:hypothetical protein